MAEVRDMREVLNEMAENDLAILTDGSMTWKPRTDPQTTISARSDGGWVFERNGIKVRRGKAEGASAVAGVLAAMAAYQRWVNLWTRRREEREAQEALANEHCVPKKFVKGWSDDGV